MLRKIFWGLGIFIVCLIVLIWWMRTDETLSVQSKELLGENYQINPNLVDHPYFYYLGIDAKDGVDPIQLGRLRYYNGWANYVNHQQSKSLIDLDGKLTKTSLDQHESEQINGLKKIWDEEGIEAFSKYISEHRAEMQNMIADNQMGLRRLNYLLSLKQYEVLAVSPETVSNIKYLSDLIWIDLVNIELNQDEKLKSYLETYKKWNAFNQKPISLVEKIVSNLHLERLIDLIRAEQLKQQNANLVQLEFFTDEQLSSKFGIHELLVYQHLVNLYQAEDLGPYRSWVYLPIKTINQVVGDLYPYTALSKLPYDQFKANLGHVKTKTRYKYALKNSVGNILAQVAKPNVEQYLVDNHITNNKIMVFNALNQGVLDLDVLNQNKQGYEFYKTTNDLCIKNPHPNVKSLESPRSRRDSCVKLVL